MGRKAMKKYDCHQQLDRKENVMSRFVFGKLLPAALLAVVTTSSIFAAESISVAPKSGSISMKDARKSRKIKKKVTGSTRRISAKAGTYARISARAGAHAPARTKVKPKAYTRKCSRRKICS
jgi:hypothetical protein